MIIIWGSKGSGKTSFLSALFFAIQQKKEWVMYPEDEESRKFIQNGYEAFIKEKVFPLTTMPDDINRVFQFDIGKEPTNLISKIKYKYRLGTYKSIKTCFLDPSGEFFEQPDKEKVFGNFISEHIQKAQGIICLIDPDRNDSISENDKSYFTLLFENFSKIRSLLTSSSSPSLDKIPLPLAICISKIDMHKEYIDSSKAYAEKIIGDFALSIIYNYFDQNYINYFACSSVGFKEDGTPNIIQDSTGTLRPAEIIKPINLIEPIEWIMKKI